jgi:hypothetical protein
VIAQIVGRLHVRATNRQVIRAVYRALSATGRNAEHRAWRKGLYDEAIEEHAQNRAYALAVARGLL